MTINGEDFYLLSKLQPLDHTVVNTKTQREYDILMNIFTSQNWKWCNGDRANIVLETFLDYKIKTCVNAEPNFRYCDEKFYMSTKTRIISLSQFLRIEGIIKEI